jgi:hypothetical protein
MEELIKEAFSGSGGFIDARIENGQYDLIGPNGEIILPKIWETSVEPGWAVSIDIWPTPKDALYVRGMLPRSHDYGSSQTLRVTRKGK